MNKYIIKEADIDLRLDVFLSQQNVHLSRTQISRVIKNNLVYINKKQGRAKDRLSLGDVVTFEKLEEEIHIKPQHTNLDILFEDEHLAFINKPIHMPIHLDTHHKENTLVNYLVGHFGTHQLADVGDPNRPGIIHRLDQNTSGVMVILKSNEAYLPMLEIFASHNLKREYHAITKGYFITKNGIIDNNIGRDPKTKTKMAVTKDGKKAITNYRVLKESNDISLVECHLLTGRTHQIRVHLSHIGHPIIGDKMYGDSNTNKKYQQNYPLLHAKRLAFIHPMTSKLLDISAPYPDGFRRKLDLMKEI